MTIGTISPPGSRSEGVAVPLLRDGDRLTQPEFHRRYLATPPGVKAELVEGIVYMASPLGNRHGRSGLCAAFILGNYEIATPGVLGNENATLILGPTSEPQPDLHLRLSPEHGGRMGLVDDILTGPPELVIEISHSAERVDLGVKRRDYARAGVLEYLVVLVRQGRLRAFGPDGTEPPVDDDNVYRSRAFPELWVDVAAVLAADMVRAIRTLNKGLKTPEHGAFVEKLNPRRAKSKPAARKRSSPKRKRSGRGE